MQHAVAAVQGIDNAITKLKQRRYILLKPKRDVPSMSEVENQPIFGFPESLKKLGEYAVDAINKFDSALKDDLNMPLAWRAFFEFLNNIQIVLTAKGSTITLSDISDAFEALARMDRVLAVVFEDYEKEKSIPELALDDEEMGIAAPLDPICFPDEVTHLIKRRESLKASKDYVGADDLRKELLDMGYRLIDDKNNRCRVYYTHKYQPKT
jgi:cysteinyl-tRNA synthetase